jgi:multidrug efflux pump subunit AcrA (membrane-fusion protein)
MTPRNHFHHSEDSKPLHQAPWRTDLDRVRLIIGAFISPLIAGLLASCASPLNTDAADGPAVSVRVAPAVLGNITASSVYVARVEARNQVDVMPLGTGRIQQLKVDVGSEVQEGQVIAVVSHGTLDAELQQAQATLLNAEAQLAKLRAEVEPNRIEAVARVDAARARLEQLIRPSPRRVSEGNVAESQA